MRIEEIVQELKTQGVGVERLYVFYYGTESFLGEVDSESGFTGQNPRIFHVKNPKRVLRLQQVSGGGFVLSFTVIDFDLMGDGKIEVRNPIINYKVTDQPEETQEAILGAYLEYFKRKVENRAVDAGLVLPKTTLSPFRKDK